MKAALLVLVLAGLQEKKLPVPDAAAQKQAEKLVRDVFKEDYAKKPAADRAALAKKLLAQARETDDDPAARFVLLREARDLARDAGDWAAAQEAIDAAGKLFEGEVVSPKLALYAAMSKAARTPEELGALARRHLDLAEEASAAEQFEVAGKAVAEASALARKAKDIPLASRADAKGKEIADRRAWQARVAKAVETLAKAPADPEANGVLGRQEAVLRGDWEKGLPRLAKGPDPEFKAAAERDLAKPHDPAARIAAGDAWWDLAEKETLAQAKRNLKARALHWYEQAPTATGLARVKIDKRMLEVRLAQFPGRWVDLTDPGLFGLPGKPGDPIAVTGDREGTRVLLQKPLEGEFDAFTVRFRCRKAPEGVAAVWFEAIDRGITLGRGTRSASFMYVEGEKLKIDRPVPIADKDDFTVTVVLSRGEYGGYVDGREIGRLGAKASRLSLLALQVEDGTVSFDQLMVRRKE